MARLLANLQQFRRHSSMIEGKDYTWPSLLFVPGPNGNCGRQRGGSSASVVRGGRAIATVISAVSQSFDMSEEKTCIRCGLTLPLLQFYQFKGGKDGRQSYCKSCSREVHKAWRSNSSVKVHLAEYMRSYRRRAKETAVTPEVDKFTK